MDWKRLVFAVSQTVVEGDNDLGRTDDLLHIISRRRSSREMLTTDC